MQKLDLGVDYNSETDPKTAQDEPLTAEPPESGHKTTSGSSEHPKTTTASPTARPTTTTTSSSSMKKKTAPISLLIAVIAIIAGSATGVGAFKLQSQGDPLLSGQEIQQVAGDSVENGEVFGTAEEGNFKDSAEGYLTIGGFEGEGSHKLLRPGGEDQTVYLISSITDLDKLDGMTVKVWGETYSGQKVGWLMDVGRIQVVDTQGTPPTEE